MDEILKFWFATIMAGIVTLTADYGFDKSWNFWIIWVIALVVIYGGFIILDDDWFN